MTETLPGILLVAFGVGTRQGAPALRAFEAKVRAAFPGHPVHWAFTARLESRRPALDKEPGQAVAEALQRFARDGARRIAVQALHLVPGAEHDELLQETKAFTQNCPGLKVCVGDPLLTDETSLHRTALAMRAVFPPPALAQEACIWVGHGTRHAAQSQYLRLAELLRAETPPVFLGTLKGGAGVDTLLPKLAQNAVTQVCLLPFFALPGRHAAYDLAGKNSRSWRSKLESAGLRCRVLPQGMVEHDLFAAMWLERLRDALAGCA